MVITLPQPAQIVPGARLGEGISLPVLSMRAVAR